MSTGNGFAARLTRAELKLGASQDEWPGVVFVDGAGREIGTGREVDLAPYEAWARAHPHGPVTIVVMRRTAGRGEPDTGT